MALQFWVISIIAGLSQYLLVIFMNRKPEDRGEVSHKLALLGSGSASFGMFGVCWASSAGQVIPPRWNDPAFVLAVLTGISGFSTFLFSAVLLLMSSIRKRYHVMPRKERRIVVFPPGFLMLCLLLFPFLKIHQGTLVVESGRILPFGSSYNFIPGVETKLVGLNNPITVSVRRKVKSAYYGEVEMWFSAIVYLRLQPGDEVPTDIKPYSLDRELTAWFDQRLDGRFSVEPHWVNSGDRLVADQEMQRSVGSREDGFVMNIPVSWDGTYSFGPQR